MNNSVQANRELLAEVCNQGDPGRLVDLVNQGASPDAHNVTNTALMLAARYGLLEAVTALLDAGADPNIVNSGGDTALSWAESCNHEAIAGVLRPVTNSTRARPIHTVPHFVSE